jgi:hypothetical protein
LYVLFLFVLENFRIREFKFQTIFLFRDMFVIHTKFPQFATNPWAAIRPAEGQPPAVLRVRL